MAPIGDNPYSIINLELLFNSFNEKEQECT